MEKVRRRSTIPLRASELCRGTTAVSARETQFECSYETQRQESCCEGLLGRGLACIDKRPLFAPRAPQKACSFGPCKAGIASIMRQCRRLCFILHGQVLLYALYSVCPPVGASQSLVCPGSSAGNALFTAANRLMAPSAALHFNIVISLQT